KNEGKRKTNQKIDGLELPLFELDTIDNATNNFSFSNKIEKDGFGHVYKEKCKWTKNVGPLMTRMVHEKGENPSTH
ncbi:hypothetical protein Ddye_027164, partial [Dipteronia dyeriana]